MDDWSTFEHLRDELTGKRCFDGRSLHHLGTSSLNPYEKAIGIVGNTLSAYDEDNMIPCFGFGDSKESLYTPSFPCPSQMASFLLNDC
jgi:hypothetical protein